MQLYSNRYGFTLVELLVVITIIALLAAIIFPVYGHAKERAKRYGCINNSRQLAAALEMYAQDHDGTYPPDTGSQPWSTALAGYADNSLFDCPYTTTVGTATAPEYGINRFALGQTTSGATDISKIPLTAEIEQPYNSKKPNCAIDNPEEDVAARHAGGTVVSFADGHVAWEQITLGHGHNGDPLLNAGVDLMAALPTVFAQQQDASFTVPNVDPEDPDPANPTLWPRFNGVMLGTMSGGYKTNHVQPNIVVDYDLSTTSRSQSGTALVCVGYPNMDHIPRNAAGEPYCDSSDPSAPKPSGIQFNAYESGLSTPSFENMVVLYLNRGHGDWPPNACNNSIPQREYGTSFRNVHIRGLVVGNKATLSLYGAHSKTIYSVGLDLAAAGTTWNQPDDQNAVWIHGYTVPNDNFTATVSNCTVRLLPPWVTDVGDADTWTAH